MKKLILTCISSFLVGSLFAGFVALSLARDASRHWADNERLAVAFRLTELGNLASRKDDWRLVEAMYRSSDAIRSNRPHTSWGWTFPLSAWALPRGDDNPHRVIDQAIIAYALERNGEDAKAELVYQSMLIEFPQYSREGLTKIAQAALAN